MADYGADREFGSDAWKRGQGESDVNPPGMPETEFLGWVRNHWDGQEGGGGDGGSPVLSRDPVYLAACIMGEAAEAWDVIKKAYREGRDELTVEEWVALRLELGDAYHYLTRLADFFGMEMDDVRAENVRKLERRYGYGEGRR